MQIRQGKWLLMISLFILMAGCGQKRALYLPDEGEKAPIELTEDTDN